MSTGSGPTVSLAEIAVALETYAGPPTARRAPTPRRSRPWRVMAALAALALVVVGVAYAAGVGPFAGISAADHLASPGDAIPGALAAGIAEASASMEQMGQGHLIVDSSRLVSELPNGMRFYTIATSKGDLCLADVEPAGTSGLSCGGSLSESRPITIGSEKIGPATPQVSYGLAIDGVVSVSFAAGGTETTVHVKDNIWVYVGDANLRQITVQWADGHTQTLIDGKTQ